MSMQQEAEAAAFRKLRQLMGYFEDDSFTKITISGDDATRTWHLSIKGGGNYFGNSLIEVVNKAHHEET